MCIDYAGEQSQAGPLRCGVTMVTLKQTNKNKPEQREIKFKHAVWHQHRTFRPSGGSKRWDFFLIYGEFSKGPVCQKGNFNFSDTVSDPLGCPSLKDMNNVVKKNGSAIDDML